MVAAGLLAAALASLAAAAAPGGAAVLAPIAEQTFNDPQGDAKGRLDIASVTMRSGSDSSISMKVYIPSSKTINSGEELGMLIDTDLQASTGSPNGGYDTWWEVRGGGAGAITFYRWTGSWTRKHFASYDGSQIDFGLTVAFHLSEIGSPNAIRFYAYTRQATTNTGMDFAPDTTQWTFTIAAPSGGGSVDTTAPSRPGGLQARALGPTSVSLEWSPSTDAGGVRRYLISRNGVDIAGSVRKASYVDRTAKPGTRYTYRVQAEDRAGNISRAASTTVRTPGAATRPEVSASLNLIGPKTIPSSPVAGQQFSVGFKVQLVRTGSPRKPVRGGEVQCRATTGSRRLVVDLSGFFKGVATCAWPVPSSARGSTLRAEVTVRSGGLSATKSFSERVR